MTNKETLFYRFGMEKNIAARLINGLPLLYGEKGRFGVQLYQYFSWVDDVVDKGNLPNLQKKAFIDRQIAMVSGDTLRDPHHMEVLFSKLQWDIVPEEAIRHQSLVLLHSIGDDVAHMPLLPRTEQELTLYHWKTVIPIVEIASLVLNGRMIKVTREFLNLITHWERKDHVNHFMRDTSIELIKLPLKEDDYNEIVGLALPYRRDRLLEIFNRDRLNTLQQTNLRGMRQHLHSIWDTNLPLTQKVAFVGYLWFRIQFNTQKYSRYYHK